MKNFKESLPTFGLLVLLLICLVYSYIKEDKESVNLLQDVKIVPTLITNLSDNTIWCSTFQLIWNDLVNEVVGKDVIFLDDQSNQMMLDLNKKTFKESDISDDYYYKKYGYMTPSLKEEIKNGIKTKFNETSDILNEFEFTEDSDSYFFYAMLVREFEFIYPFDVLNNKEFGITNHSKEELDKNIKVLFYENANKYAVLLNTKDNDEIILVKGATGNNFLEIYQTLNFNKLEEFKSEDTISVSNFNFKVKGNFKEIENKEFFIGNYKYKINKTLQVINFKMDNVGGKVKSEAGMDVNKTALEVGNHFDFTDNFTLFIKEKDKKLPYLAIKVNDIEKFR